MNVNNIFIFILIFPLILFSQIKESNSSSELLLVKYEHSIHMENLPTATTVNAFLRVNKYGSIYEMDFLNNSNFQKEEDSESVAIFAIKPKVNDFIYKNLVTKDIFSIQRIGMKPFLVRDSDTIFNWTIKNEFEYILGYKSQKATTTHRGRDYIAYFTTEIEFNNGPWKFGNLPGLILKVFSEDDVFKIVANEIEIRNTENEIENPYIDNIDKSISWEAFTNAYKKKSEELKHYRSPDGGVRSIPKRGIETYIED